MQSEKQGSNSASFTKGETLPLNSNHIIPQNNAVDTQWQQFIHNALPNELKHYEKLSGEQLNKIKEANELDKDNIFSQGGIITLKY